MTFTDSGLLRLAGDDAEAFAQSQFANDVNTLAPGHWQWNCWLNAKGRVLAIFALLRPQAGELLLVLPDGRAEALGQALARYVFRRKVKLELASELHACGALQLPAQAAGNRIAVLADGSLELDMGGDGLDRSLHIGTLCRPAAEDQALAWRQADLQLGLARLDGSQLETWTPQQLGLDRLSGYSVRKGCYPGQEIVARTHFLGKAKRAIALLCLEAPAQPGDAVHSEGREVGQLVSIAGNQALAVLPLDGVATPLQVNGVAARALPIRGGLAR